MINIRRRHDIYHTVHKPVSFHPMFVSSLQKSDGGLIYYGFGLRRFGFVLRKNGAVVIYYGFAVRNYEFALRKNGGGLIYYTFVVIYYGFGLRK